MGLDSEIKKKLWDFCPSEEPNCNNDPIWFFDGTISTPASSLYHQFIKNIDVLSEKFLKVVQSIGEIYSDSFYLIGDEESKLRVTELDNHHTCIIVKK